MASVALCYGYHVNFYSLFRASLAWPTIKTLRLIRKRKWNNTLVSSAPGTNLASLPAEVLEMIDAYAREATFDVVTTRWPLAERCDCNHLDQPGAVMPEDLEDMYNDYVTNELVMMEQEMRVKQSTLDVQVALASSALSDIITKLEKEPNDDVLLLKKASMEQELREMQGQWYMTEYDGQEHFNHEYSNANFKRWNLDFRKTRIYQEYAEEAAVKRFPTCDQCRKNRFRISEYLCCDGNSGRPHVNKGYRDDERTFHQHIFAFLDAHDCTIVEGSEGNYEQYCSSQISELHTLIANYEDANGHHDYLVGNYESQSILIDPVSMGADRSGIQKQMEMMAVNFRMEAADFEEDEGEAVVHTTDFSIAEQMRADAYRLIPGWMMFVQKRMDRKSAEYTGVPPAVPNSEDEDSDG